MMSVLQKRNLFFFFFLFSQSGEDALPTLSSLREKDAGDGECVFRI